jgi:hypothetical protein
MTAVKSLSATNFSAFTAVNLPYCPGPKIFKLNPLILKGMHRIDVLPKQFPKKKKKLCEIKKCD